VILGRENVAGSPAHVGAELNQRLDEDRGLDGHVQRAGDPDALEGLARAELLADGDQAGHLVLGDGDFLATPVGQGDVAHVIIAGAGRGGGSHNDEDAVERCRRLGLVSALTAP
jgi:hypothetical protein